VEQRIGRIDSIGQKQPSLPIRNLFLADSVDMQVYAALRRRCGLFEHFVGPMQPVLAQAASFLRGRARQDEVSAALSQLETTAAAVNADAAVAAVFEDSETPPVPGVAASADRATLNLALERLLSGGMAVRAKRLKQSGVWRLTGLGRKVEASTDSEALERDSSVQPLALGSPLVPEVAAKLPLPVGTPLVIASWSGGPYHCEEARWVMADGSSCVVENAEALISLAEAWDGTPPGLAALKQAEKEARAAAARRVRDRESTAEQVERTALRRQREAARLRLLRELGRTLRCYGSGDLAGLLRQRLEQDGPNSRYGRAAALLDNFPQWSTAEAAEIDAYVSQLSESERNGRVRLGAELEAAINDPRWRAPEPH